MRPEGFFGKLVGRFTNDTSKPDFSPERFKAPASPAAQAYEERTQRAVDALRNKPKSDYDKKLAEAKAATATFKDSPPANTYEGQMKMRGQNRNDIAQLNAVLETMEPTAPQVPTPEHPSLETILANMPEAPQPIHPAEVKNLEQRGVEELRQVRQMLNTSPEAHKLPPTGTE